MFFISFNCLSSMARIEQKHCKESTTVEKQVISSESLSVILDDEEEEEL